MANKHLTVPPTDVALARLKVFLESVNDLYHSGEMVLESNLVSSYHEALNLFYASLDSSVVNSLLYIYKGAPADPTAFNILTSAMLKDMKAVFSEIGALDRVIAASFNSIVSEHRQVIDTSKKISNKLGDYLLYADPKLGAGFFFGDSFTSPDRVEVGSSLVDTDECFISPEEGIVLLPLDGQPDIPAIKSIIVNKPSNGEPGNNYQIDVFGHEEIDTIGDGEPNTWFEYERVTTSESNKPLILDITIVLREVSIINHININPINFGTATPIKITKIETSKDGADFSSIKDEVPIRDFVAEEEKEEFDLSPATSKFSGQGFYSFLPRKVQYIHIVLEQHDPYTIETNNGLRLRYAIGIRDVNIYGRKFRAEGSIVSVPFSANNTIRKVSLWASENPIEESVLADLRHFVSYNDGASWLPIQPQRRTSTEVPEVVNFNNISENSITTEEDVDTLRHKISMTRNKDSFKGDVTVKEERLKKMDVVSTPGVGDFSVSLTERPIERSVNVVFPFLGSFSCPRPRLGAAIVGQSSPMDLDFVEFVVDLPGERIRESDDAREGSIRFKLPFKNISNLEQRIRVFVNGEQIEYCPKVSTAFASPPTSHSSPINSDSKIYFLNKNGTELQFGHTESDGTQRGYIPAGGSRVQVSLDGDNPFLRLTDRGYILHLSTPSDGQKESTSILALTNLTDTEGAPHEIEIPSGTEKYRRHPSTSTIDSTTLTEDEKLSVDAAKKVVPREFGGEKSSLGKTSGTSGNTGERSDKGSLSSTGVDYKKGKVDRKALPTSLPDRKAADYLAKRQDDFIRPPIEMIEIESDHENEDLVGYEGSFFVELYEGMWPPVYIESDNGLDHFDIIEYDLSGNIITDGSRRYTDKVVFQDGDTELRDADNNWEKVSSRYTFDHYTGAVYLGSAPSADRRTVLVCQKRDVKVIDQMFWKFDHNQVTGKVNTQKILLDPRVVFTIKRVEEFSYSLSSPNIKKISLVSDNDISHSWTNIHIVRGTVRPDVSLFSSDAQPIEVKFIDGEIEFSNNVKINNESVSFTSHATLSNVYYYTLAEVDASSGKTLVGTPAFAPVRSITSASAPTNEFDLIPSSSMPASNGQWYVLDNIVYMYLDSQPDDGSYTISYRINNADPGIDINGMYSVDYNNGVIHFASPMPADGNVEFEVSAYSAFYNLAEQVSLGDIEKIDEDSRTITFNSAFGMRFLKQDTVLKARPQVLKIFYEYYKKSTESLEDIEPYFSPICKDLAFRTVTSNLLEEL